MPTNTSSRVWLSLAFAILLCAMKLLLPNGGGYPAFYCFLPMCFLFVAQSRAVKLKRVDELIDIARPVTPVPER